MLIHGSFSINFLLFIVKIAKQQKLLLTFFIYEFFRTFSYMYLSWVLSDILYIHTIVNLWKNWKFPYRLTHNNANARLRNWLQLNAYHSLICLFWLVVLRYYFSSSIFFVIRVTTCITGKKTINFNNILFMI